MHERVTCEQMEVGIAEYLDGALPQALGRRFEAHLGGCAECGDHFRRIRRTIDHLKNFPREPMPLRIKRRLVDTARSIPLPLPRPLHLATPDRALR